MDFEGEQLLGVHVIERAQLGQLQQQLGEDGGLVRVVCHDQVPQSSDQSLLQGLHAAYVLDGRSVCENMQPSISFTKEAIADANTSKCV